MNKHQVMVIEDDHEIREALIEILEENGYAVVGAANGERALTYLRSAEVLPCLILLDLMMPVMDGASFRQVQLADPALRNIPVVVVSAFGDVHTSTADLRPVSILKKPPRIEELVQVVERNC